MSRPSPGGSPPRPRPIVSVLTPTRLHPQRIGFLRELHADLSAGNCEFEWILAVDGTHRRALPETIAADPHTRVLRIGRQVGAAAARNLALGLARGTYVTSADDDDHLPAGSLETRLATARRHRVGWVAGALADLRAGVITRCGSTVPAGPVAPGEVWRAWGCPCLSFPLGPTTLLVRTELLRSVGGWQGLPQAEDLGMVLSVTARTAGIMLDSVVYAYRKHGHQMTTGGDFPQLEPLARHITFERGRLLAALTPLDGPATSSADRAPGSSIAGWRSTSPSLRNSCSCKPARTSSPSGSSGLWSSGSTAPPTPGMRSVLVVRPTGRWLTRASRGRSSRRSTAAVAPR